MKECDPRQISLSEFGMARPPLVCFAMHRRIRAGFTLVELLTAGVVFILLLMLVTQLLGLTQDSSSRMKRKINAEHEARNTLDRIGRDIAQAIFRADVDFKAVSLAGNDAMAFLTEAPSYNSSRRLALISYRVRAAGLERGVLGLDVDKMVFLPGTLDTISGTTEGKPLDEILLDEAYDLISPGVVRAEFFLVNKNGGLLDANAEWKPRDIDGVLAVLVIMSSDVRKLLSDDDVILLANQFPDLTLPSLPESPADSWIGVLESPAFQAQQLPLRVKQELRVSQRFYPLVP
jgi:type II secretory pathway component PulJ